MNIVHVFDNGTAFLVKSAKPNNNNNNGSFAYYVLQVYSVSPQLDLHRVSASCESVCLAVEKNNSILTKHVFTPHYFFTNEKVNPPVNMDTLWPVTAPLAPTTAFLASLSLPPLLRIIGSNTQQNQGGESEEVLYHCLYRSFLAEYIQEQLLYFNSEVNTNHNSRRPIIPCSRPPTQWELVRMTYVCLSYEKPPLQGSHPNSRRNSPASGNRSRTLSSSSPYSLEQYIDRSYEREGGSQARRSVLAWGEEMWWRLLGGLLAGLAVLHSGGGYYGGKITERDILCFATTTEEAMNVMEAVRSSYAQYAMHNNNNNKDEKEVDTFINSVVQLIHESVIQPVCFITDTTEAHDSFFVLRTVPHSLQLDRANALHRDEESPHMMEKYQQRDIAAVADVVLKVVETQRVARSGDNKDDNVSSELIFLLQRLAKLDDDTNNNNNNSNNSISASQLCQLQAIRLRALRCYYALSAKESITFTNTLLLQRQTSMAQQQQHQQTPDPTPQRRELEQALHEKEVSLAEREKVLDRREKDFQSLLSLYELTYEHVDQLQKGVLPSHNKTNANHNHNNSHSDMQSQFQRELNHSSQLAKHLIVNHRNNKSNQNNSYTDPLSASPSLLDVIEVDMKTEEEEYTNNNNLNRTPPQQRMVSSSPTPHSQPPSHVKLGNNDNNNNTVDLLRQTPPVLPNLGSDHLMPVNNAPFTATSSGRKYSGDKWNNNNNMNNANRREVSRSLGFEEDDGTNPNNNNKNTPKKEESPFRASTPKARRGSRGEHLPAASPYDLHPATVINDKTVSSVTDLYHTLEALQQEFKLQSARSPSSRRTPSPSVYSTPKVTTSDRNNHHHPTESGKLKTNMSVNTTTATSSARSSRKINHNNNSGKRSYENTKSRYQASNNSNHNNKSYVPTTLEGAELLRKLRGM